MTRAEAKKFIYDVINSGIIDIELENNLTEIANHICDDAWDACSMEMAEPYYCEGCIHDVS